MTSDARLKAAVAHWGPRFVANGVVLTDFEEVTSSITSYDEWCKAWSVRAAHHERRLGQFQQPLPGHAAHRRPRLLGPERVVEDQGDQTVALLLRFCHLLTSREESSNPTRAATGSGAGHCCRQHLPAVLPEPHRE